MTGLIKLIGQNVHIRNLRGAEYIGQLLAVNLSGKPVIRVEQIRLGDLDWQVLKYPELQTISDPDIVKGM